MPWQHHRIYLKVEDLVYGNQVLQDILLKTDTLLKKYGEQLLVLHHDFILAYSRLIKIIVSCVTADT